MVFDPFVSPGTDPFQNHSSSLSRKKVVFATGALILLTGILVTIALVFRTPSLAVRFAEALSSSQQETEYTLRDEYFVHLREMMWLLTNAPQEVMRESDLLKESDTKVTTLLTQGIESFPFDLFSSEEWQRIHDFFAILTTVNTERHRHALEMTECVRMTLLHIESATEFCEEEQQRYAETTTRYKERFPQSFPDLLGDENAFMTLFLRSEKDILG